MIIKNTGGVTLTAANTIAADLVATKAVIKGSAANGITIDSDAASITVNSDESVAVAGMGAQIVAGTGDNTVTVKGATLKPGVYTGAAAQLSLGNTGEIEVAGGGAIEVAGNGDLALTTAASKVVLLAGGAVDVKAATGKFGEATQTETKVTVAAAGDLSAATKAAVVKAADSAVWTVTTDGTGTSATDVVLGALKLTITGTGAVNAQTGADSGGSAAAGKLVAGAGTAITFIGTD